MLFSELRRKLLWLIAIRVAISTLVLGWAILAGIGTPRAAIDPAFLLIGLTYALTIVYLVAMRYLERFRWIVDVQLVADALIVAAFISITGGVTSYFSSLFFLPIFAATKLQRRRGGVAVAVLSAVAYAGLVFAQYQDAAGRLAPFWLGNSLVVLPPVQVAVYTVAVNVSGFIAVAVLGGSLAEGLRRAGAHLEQASNEIADLRAFSQNVIDSLASGLVTTDDSGCVLTFNRAAEEITGCPASKAVGRPVEEVLQLPPDFTASLKVDLDRARSRRLDFQYTTDAAMQIDIGVSTTRLVTSSGPKGFLFTFQDITNVKKMEREARLQQRLAAVGEMAAGIAHEIRNPLASMSGSIQVLRHDLRLTEEQAQLMDIVLRESERLNHIIKNFLSYARPQRRQVSLVDLRRAIQDTAALLRNSSEVRQDHLIEVDLPAAGIPCEADEGQVREIVWNLATNGLRAMPTGGRLRLVAALEPLSGSLGPGTEGCGQAVLRVEDQGVGIAPEVMDRIFQPFQGAFPRGSGLGLAVVHRIVSDYGGDIRIQSAPGSGTTVEVVLPVRAGVPSRSAAGARLPDPRVPVSPIARTSEQPDEAPNELATVGLR